MGMYTRLVLNVAIEEDAPIVTEVAAMVANKGTHKGRRAWMLGSSSYYHDKINACSFEHDDISKTWKLSVCCDLKNYEDEVAWFLDFIAPHVATDDLAGYVRYEETVSPTLVWFRAGKPVLFEPTLPPEID